MRLFMGSKAARNIYRGVYTLQHGTVYTDKIVPFSKQLVVTRSVDVVVISQMGRRVNLGDTLGARFSAVYLQLIVSINVWASNSFLHINRYSEFRYCYLELVEGSLN